MQVHYPANPSICILLIIKNPEGEQKRLLTFGKESINIPVLSIPERINYSSVTIGLYFGTSVFMIAQPIR